MTPDTPSLEPAIAAVREYAEAHASGLSAQQSETLREVVRRLQHLAVQAAELIGINNRLWAKESLAVSFDPQTESLVVSFGGVEERFKLNRADPNVPIKAQELTAGAAYHAGKDPAPDPEQEALRLDLEVKLESYYQSAHRVLKLLRTVPTLAGVRCTPITRVRNNLVEHPQDGALYTFGFGSTGPRVKPMHQGKPLWNDDGLVPNTRCLVDAIVEACRSRAP